MTLVIRTGAATDRAALAALHTASWRASYGPFVPPEALGAPLDANMQQRWLTWPAERRIVVAERDGIVVGFAALEPGPDPLLDNLHVDPTCRCDGIGSAVLCGVGARLHGEDVHSFHLTVLEGNTAARRFYRRHGGVEGAVEDDRLLGHPVSVVPVRWSADAVAALAADFAGLAGKDA